MSLSFFIARRYLFSKKSHNAINIISAIAATGIAVATAAMVCTLSVFNGFHDLISTLYCNFDPQLQVTAATGKTFDIDDPAVDSMRNHRDVVCASECLEDNALILFRGHPLVINVKGVDSSFVHVTNIDSILFGNGDILGADGSLSLDRAGIHYGIPGIGLAQQMGGADYGTLQICAPRSGERINLANPIESLSVEDLQSPHVVFSVNQRKYDEHYLITSLDFAQSLFEKEGLASSLELRLRPGASTDAVKAELRAIGGDRFEVRDQLEQQADVFAIMNVEKLLAYVFLTFIVLVACFNIISSLSMLIIEKKDDAQTLRHLGMTSGRIRSIFMTEGRMISFVGAVAGVLLGVALCLVQQQFGLIQLGGAGSFIVDAYPVSVHWLDIVVVFVTVIAVGFIAVWYPVHALSKRLLS